MPPARLALAALLCLAGLVAAGTAAAPEVVDDEGDAAAPGLSGDILAAWIEGEDETGFVTVIRLASFDPLRDRLTDHYFVFEALGKTWCTYVYVDPTGGTDAGASEWDAGTRFQTGGGADTEPSVEPGSPAYVRAPFPFEVFGAEDGPIPLGPFVVETFDFKRVTEPQSAPSAGAMVRVDHADSDATYVARAATAPAAAGAGGTGDPAPEPTAEAPRSTPGIGLASAAAAALAAARCRRATPRHED